MPMTPAFGGELETLTVELNGCRRRITLERRGPWTAPLWLLLPALSTVSSRSEWQPLAEEVGDRRQLLSFDWPGFGGSDRDAIPYSAESMGAALRAVLEHLGRERDQRITVIAAGHSTPIALGQAATWSSHWRKFVAVAPTWRGPLPTMSGWPPRRFGWLRKLVMLPLIGPLLYRLNTSLPMLRLMLRRHVWVNSAWLTPERLHQQQRLARRPRARFASAAFVSGGLDCTTDPHWWRRQTPMLQCPFHVVVASEAPPRSRRSMEQLAQDAHQVTVIPGRLGLHQEFGALLAEKLLAG